MTFTNLSTRKDTGLDSWRALWCLWITEDGEGLGTGQGRGWGHSRGRPGRAALYRPIRKKFPVFVTDMAGLNTHSGDLHFSEYKWNS